MASYKMKKMQKKKNNQKKSEEKASFELGINMFKEIEVPLKDYKKGEF